MRSPISKRLHAFLVVLIVACVAPVRAQTLFVRHAPEIDGTVEGSVQMMTGEPLALGGSAELTGDLLVPGSPEVRIDRRASLGATVVGSGSSKPTHYRVRLEGGARLGRLVTRTDPVEIPEVPRPTRPIGRRDVELNRRHQDPGNPATLRNLAIGSGIRNIALPAGAYGSFVANGGSDFSFAGSELSAPAAYSLRDLTLNGGSDLVVTGPVVIVLESDIIANGGTLGNPAHPEWLRVRIAKGNLVLRGAAEFHGYVEAPRGTVSLQGRSRLVGGIASAHLEVRGRSVIRAVALPGPVAPFATLPWTANFEESEGFRLGSLRGQGRWIVGAGAAEVTGTMAFDGLRSAVLLPGSTAAAVGLAFAVPAAEAGRAVTFVDFVALPVVGATPDAGSLFDLGGATIGFVRNVGSVSPAVRIADTTGPDAWQTTGAALEFDGAGTATRWVRLTARLDYQGSTWDLFVDGNLRLWDIPLRLQDGRPPSGLGRFLVNGSTAVASHLDFLYAGFENPLFADSDNDGLEDAWELRNGLDPSTSDRTGDLDGDGLSNLEESQVGSAADDFFNGIDPIPMALHGSGPGPDDDLAMLVRRPDGTPWPNAPVIFQVTAGQRRISLVPGGPEFVSDAEVRTDANGIARVYLEPLAP